MEDTMEDTMEEKGFTFFVCVSSFSPFYHIFSYKTRETVPNYSFINLDSSNAVSSLVFSPSNRNIYFFSFFFSSLKMKRKITNTKV